MPQMLQTAVADMVAALAPAGAEEAVPVGVILPARVDASTMLVKV